MALLSACAYRAQCSMTSDAAVRRIRQADILHFGCCSTARCRKATPAPAISCSRATQRMRHALHVRQDARMYRRARRHAANSAQQMAAAPEQSTAAPLSRQERNRLQAAAYGDPMIRASLFPSHADTKKKLESVAAAVPDLGAHSRVIVIGSGTGVLIRHLKARNVRDILAVDPAQPLPPRPLPGYERLLDEISRPQRVRAWYGDIVDLPACEGPADATFFNSTFAQVHDQHEALWALCRLLRPGGHIAISNPLGRFWSSRLSERSPMLVPHILPSVGELQKLIHDLPLRSVDAQRLRNCLYPDGSCHDGLYLRLLQQGPSEELRLPASTTDLLLYHSVANALNSRFSRQEPATFAQVAKALDLPVSQVIQTVCASCVSNNLLQPPVDQWDYLENTLALAYVGEDATHEFTLSWRSVKKQVRLALDGLPERSQEVLCYRYGVHVALGRPLTLHEVGLLYNYKISTVRKIEDSASATMKQTVQKALGMSASYKEYLA